MADVQRPAKPKLKKTCPDSKSSVFWTDTTMSSKLQTIVPGVNISGNRRPCVKGGKTKEVKACIPVKQPVVETTDSQGTAPSLGLISDMSTIETEVPKTKKKQVSLRDLCVEDKKRVANLIKELAKIADEKENAEQNLFKERNHYQDQILKLVEQQEMVLKEREEVQMKLLEYQNLIVRLQQDQQLQSSHQHKEKYHKLPQKNTAFTEKEKETIVLNGAKEKKSDQLRKNVHSTRRSPLEALSEPDQGDNEGDEEHNSHREEHDSLVEMPSQNIYMNELEESDVDEFSTQVLHSFLPSSDKDQLQSSSYRPFTNMIDQELAKQKAALAAVGFHSYDQSNEQHEKSLKPGYLDSKHTQEKSAASKYKPASSYERDDNKETNYHQSQGLKEFSDNKDNQREIDINVKYSLPSKSLVSPEKAEIFNRFMQSNPHETQTTEVERREEVDTVTADMKNMINEEERKRRKKKKRPPPAFGIFQPPIMSSTQKSSEIGDYIDSTINSDSRKLGAKDSLPQNDGGKWTDGEKRIMSKPGDAKGDNSDFGAEDKGQGEPGHWKGRSHQKKRKSKVEFYEHPDGAREPKWTDSDEENQLDVDREYLHYYKNLSASERKKELLKQRSKLLEEQNKLKQILAKQESKMMVKQAETIRQMEETDENDFKKKNDQVPTKREMQDSVEEIELRIAQKEVEVRREKELLLQKRKNLKDYMSHKASRSGAEHWPSDNKKVHHEGSEPESQSNPGRNVIFRSKTAVIEGSTQSHGLSPIDNNTFTMSGRSQGPHHTTTSSPQKEDLGPTPTVGEQFQSWKASKEVDGRDTISKSATRTTAPKTRETAEDDLAKRLDYSFHSITEPSLNEALVMENGTQSKITTSEDELSPSKSKQNHTTPTKVDAGTSITFPTFTRTESNSPVASKSASKKENVVTKGSRKKNIYRNPRAASTVTTTTITNGSGFGSRSNINIRQGKDFGHC